MEKYSCWNWGRAKRYYLTHPWVWVKDLIRNIKDICMRARYGFTWADIWNFDHWFLHVAPQMLHHMAEHGSAYPGREPFTTPEKWHDWLHEMADLLESGNEDWQDQHNEYYEEYINDLHNSWERWKDEDGLYHSTHKDLSDITKKYLERSTELAKQGDANVRRALSLMGEHFMEIWD